jgi:ABC-type lipoprotein release transport system permease subunit
MKTPSPEFQPAHANHGSGFFRMLLFISWRNIWRNPIRSLLTVSALSGSLVMLILYSALLEGMSDQMVSYATDISTGKLQIHRKAYLDDQDLYATLSWQTLNQLEKQNPELKFAPRLYAAGLASSKQNSTGVLIEAVDPKQENQVTHLLEHLRNGKADLSMAPIKNDTQDEINPEGYGVLVGTQLAKNLQLTLGSELILMTQAADGSIGNALYRVTGILSPFDPNFDRMGVLMSVPAYQDLMAMQNGMHEVAIKTPEDADLAKIQQHLQQQLAQISTQQLKSGDTLKNLGGKFVVETWKQLNPSVASMLSLSRSMLLIIGVIVVSLAALGMINTLMMAIHERTHEFGILLSIGLKRWAILVMILLESLYLAVLSAIIGAVIGGGVALRFEHHGIDFSSQLPDGYDWAGVVFEPIMKGSISMDQIWQAVILMLVLTVIASLIPALRTLKLNTAEAIR